MSVAIPTTVPSPSAHQTTRPSPDLIAAGPWDHAEFAILRQTLDPTNRWPTKATLYAAVEDVLQQAVPPELVLLAQARPGSDEQAHVERLRHAAPLTRIIIVAGAWCEGELRTGHPLAGVVRLYWYEFPSWWQAALDRIARDESPSWAEPLDDPRAAQPSPTVDAPRDLTGHVVAVDATDYAVYETLAALLSPHGCSCVWQPRHRPELFREAPTLGIWDGGQLDPRELESLHSFCTRLAASQAPVAALLDFPRVEHINQAQSAGAAALRAKPYPASALIDELLALLAEKK